MFPLASVAVHVTWLVPRGKRVPDGGAQTTVAPAQLSVAPGAKVTTASHRPDSLLVTTFAGQVTVGGSPSCTVTVKLQRLVLPLASVAVQLTAVTPLVNVAPDGGAQSTVVPGQLSFAGAAKVTTASHRPTWLFVTMFAGQVIVGTSRSCTVTVKLQRLVLPPVSVAVQFTAVTPLVNVVPDGGVHGTVDPQRFSVALAAYVTTA